MAYTYITKAGAINRTRLYKDNEAVANDIDFNISAVTPTTVTHRVGMGNIDIPMTGYFESISLTITKQGVDRALAQLSEPTSQNLTIKWAQEMIDENALSTPVGCVAKLTCIPTSIPALAITEGEIPSNELSFTVTRVEIYVDGEEFWVVDMLKCIHRINGKDYAQNTNLLV